MTELYRNVTNGQSEREDHLAGKSEQRVRRTIPETVLLSPEPDEFIF